MTIHWLDNDRVVHCGNASGDDRTLCGLVLDGFDGKYPMTETHARINCADCIQIVEFCYKVRPGEMVITRRERR